MIRLAMKEDASRLAEISIFAKRMAYSDIFNDYKVSFSEMLVLPLALEYIEKPEMLNNLYVFEDEVIKGMMKISYDKDDNYFEINELFVDPFFQNHHVGSQFASYVEELARSLGFTNLILWVLEKNQNARNFYAKNGFALTSEKKLEDGTTEYILKYLKEL
ncbi:MAG: GNAT family N-acetyltransferase [Oscillospiraceae bacterium]